MHIPLGMYEEVIKVQHKRVRPVMRRWKRRRKKRVPRGFVEVLPPETTHHKLPTLLIIAEQEELTSRRSTPRSFAHPIHPSHPAVSLSFTAAASADLPTNRIFSASPSQPLPNAAPTPRTAPTPSRVNRRVAVRFLCSTELVPVPADFAPVDEPNVSEGEGPEMEVSGPLEGRGEAVRPRQKEGRRAVVRRRS